MNRSGVLILTLVLVLVALFSCTFQVGEWEQAILIQLGKPMGTVTEPGLHFKKPFVQEVQKFDKRLLEYDASPRELITKDKQQVVVDNYSRWRIVKPLLFFQTVRNMDGAQRVLDDVIYSAIREKLGTLTLSELVSGKRSDLMGDVLVECQDKSKAYGIEVVDVRIKRADLPEKNERNVFSRMRAERERQAKKFRAEGEEEAQKIRSMAEREARVIVAEAKKQSEIVRGRGDAQSTKIYANAYNMDPQFYSFVRSLESYRKVFKDGATVLLTPDNEFLKTFNKGQ